MATRGFIKLEFFARVSSLWQSLGVRTFYPRSDAAGTETFDEYVALPCPSAIADPAGNEFRVVRVGFGNTAATDYLSGFPSVTWQVDGTTPTETAVAQSVPLRITPSNG